MENYHQQHRLQYHFSPPQQWMNDPNGMVYYDGEYHLFYQHYPDSNVWGPMHWGHAVSPDLVHWENLPIALYPDSLGYIFSGSAVVDLQNTAGFKSGNEDPLVSIFTYHDPEGAEAGTDTFQTQAIAVSNDRGRTWEKYEGNPVLRNPGIRDFRDPKVFWHEQSGRWVMILAVKDRVHFYHSPDLKSWTYASEFGADTGAHGGVWECPDLFELPVDGSGETRWVMLLSINPGGPNGGSATQYFLGDFDGETFTLDPAFAEKLTEEEGIWIDYGRDNYAGVSWSNVPPDDSRRLFLGWMSNWDYANVVPTSDWRSAMTLPRRLSLTETPEGIRLASTPVQELKLLRKEPYDLDAATVEESLDLMTGQAGFSPATMEAILEFELPEGETPLFGVELSNGQGEFYRIGYDASQNRFFSDRTRSGKTGFSDQFAEGLHFAPRIDNSRTLRLHLFFDVASAELFADDGKTVMTNIYFPSEDYTQIRLFSENGSVQLKGGQLFELGTIWEDN